MPLKLYKIATSIHHTYAIVVFHKPESDISEFFQFNIGNEEKIARRNLEFIAEEGYTLENIRETDYLDGGSGLIFSKRFVEVFIDILKDDVKIFPCKINCQGEILLDWYVVQVLRRISIIDKEKSIYRTLTDGSEIIDFPKYKENIIEPFYIARDTESVAYCVVSELFKNLCEDNNLKLDFREANKNLAYGHNFKD